MVSCITTLNYIFLAIFNMTPQWSRAPQIDAMRTYALVTAVLAIIWMVITAAHSAVIMCSKNMTFLPDDLVMRKMGLMVYYIIFAVIYTPLALTYFFLTMITMSQKKRIMLIDMDKFDYNLGYWMFAIAAILMIIQSASSIFDCVETWQDIAKARRAVRNEKINAIKGKYQQQDSQV
eukprot:UN00879